MIQFDDHNFQRGGKEPPARPFHPSWEQVSFLKKWKSASFQKARWMILMACYFFGRRSWWLENHNKVGEEFSLLGCFAFKVFQSIVIEHDNNVICTWWLQRLFVFIMFHLYIYIYIWGGLPFLTHSSSERLKYVFHPPSQPFALMEIHTLDHPALLKTVFPHTLALTTKQQHIVWQWEKWPFKDWRGDLQLGIFQGHELNHVTVEVISMTSTSLWSCVLDIQMPKGRIWFEARYASFLSRFKPIIEPWDMVISTEMTAGSIEIEGVVGL